MYIKNMLKLLDSYYFFINICIVSLLFAGYIMTIVNIYKNNYCLIPQNKTNLISTMVY